VLSGVDQNLLDCRQPTERTRYHGRLDELGPRSDNADDLHLKTRSSGFGTAVDVKVCRIGGQQLST